MALDDIQSKDCCERCADASLLGCSNRYCSCHSTARIEDGAVVIKLPHRAISVDVMMGGGGSVTTGLSESAEHAHTIPPADWENRFDEEFDFIRFAALSDKEYQEVKSFIQKLLEEEREKMPSGTEIAEANKASFQLGQESERTRLIGVIEGMKYERRYEDQILHDAASTGWSRCIVAVLEILKKEI